MVLLLFIWGSVLYKYFGKSSVIVLPFSNGSNVTNNSASHTILRDSFVLILNDKDPFRISPRRNAPVQIKELPRLDLKKKIVSQLIDWPKISYYGFVKGEQKSTKLVLIKINNKLSRKRENEKFEDVTIVKAFSDSIIVLFNKERKTIKRINAKH